MIHEITVKTFCAFLIYNMYRETAQMIFESKRPMPIKRAVLAAFSTVCFQGYLYLLWGFDSVTEFEFAVQGLLAATIAFVGVYTSQLVYVTVNKKHWDTILSVSVYIVTSLLVIAVLLLPYFLGVF